MSTFMKALTGLAISTFTTLAFANAAQAGCGSCGSATTGPSTLPPLSSYFDHQKKKHHAKTTPVKTTITHKAETVSSTLPPLTQAFTRQTAFTGTVTGLGAGESLRPTSCPVTVHNPNGGTVLGCYNVVKKVVRPVSRTTYYQVVRPIIYVRYPVSIPACGYTSCAPRPVYPTCAAKTCRTHYHGSRYGY